MLVYDISNSEDSRWLKLNCDNMHTQSIKFGSGVEMKWLNRWNDDQLRFKSKKRS